MRTNVAQKLVKNKSNDTYFTLFLVMVCNFALWFSIFLFKESEVFSLENSYNQVIILIIILSIIDIPLLFTNSKPVSNTCLLFHLIVSLVLMRILVGLIYIQVIVSLKTLTHFFVKKKLILSVFLSFSFLIIGLILVGHNEIFGTTIEIYPLNQRFIFLFFYVLFFLFSVREKSVLESNDELIIINSDKEKTIQLLSTTNLGFQEYALQIENETRVRERLDLTREIHDITGYTLTSIIMMLEHAQDLILSKSFKKTREMFKLITEQARNGHSEIRYVLKRLRAQAYTGDNLLVRIREIVDNFHLASEISINLDFTNISNNVHSKLHHLIIRLIQEGLTNAVVHGQASFIEIILFQTQQSIMIKIQDNGNGSKNIEEGIGIKGMRERILLLGGNLTYFSDEQGFHLFAELPIMRDYC